MANEYLQRTPTSTGNRKVFTWSTWVKRGILGINQNIFSSTEPALISKLLFDTNDKLTYQNNNPSFELISSQNFRDVGAWMHILFVANTTASSDSERIKLFVNGIRITSFTSSTYPAINSDLIFNYGIGHWISKESANVNYFLGEISDIFFIDGQALTPEVFGYYKPDTGYMSVGTSQATKFTKGKWSPKDPKTIKSIINAKGGFGVNGFYLPMNSSNNFGADFHTTPNTILKLKEDLPQPKAEIDGVGDYTNALRDDPFKDHLVVAIPFVSNGSQNGFGDYSHIIRGNGTALSVSSTNSPTISSNTSVYYGSSVRLIRSSSQDIVVTGFNNAIGAGDFTLEGWFRFDSRAEDFNAFNLYEGGTRKFFMQARVSQTFDFHTRFVGTNAQYNSQVIGWNDSHLNNWYHYAVSRNSGTLRFFLNGVCVGVHLNHTENIGSVDTLRIGYMTGDGTKYLDGYVQDIRYYTIGKYTNGFDVPKPYTPVGIATWRALPDTSANNFATWNPLVKSSNTFTNGNLTSTMSASTPAKIVSNIGISTGKWYAEYYYNGNINYPIGISADSISRDYLGSPDGNTSVSFWISSNGTYVYVNGNLQSFSGSSTTWASGDIAGLSLDHTNKQVSLYKNGVLVGSAWSYSSYNWTNAFFAAGNYISGNQYNINFGQNPTFSGTLTAGTFTDSNGKGLFKYQPPSGFLALCEDNLPTPAIADPGDYFKTVLYTGDGNSGRSITGVGFTPDLVWVKERNVAQDHVLHDSVRGAGYYILSNSTQQEAFNSAQITSFNSDGFTVGTSIATNENSKTFVAWCWRAGAGTTSTNTDGSIPSVVSVNQDAGFSIATYTATGSTGSIGHGLGKTPAFVITKHRNLDTHWRIWHKSLTAYNYTLFFNTGAQQSQPAYSALPTSSVINLDSDLTGSYDFVTYSWTEIEGFSKFGSYVGNGSTDGPFVYCGFKPAFVLIKASSTSGDWLIMDSSRNSTNPLSFDIYANLFNVETDFDRLDFLSNGFKNRATFSNNNANGVTYIFAAFAESPFKTNNAK